MDGFHLANSELARLGRADRKGAPDIFDVDGYVALLNRLRRPGDAPIYAPVFNRGIDPPGAGPTSSCICRTRPAIADDSRPGHRDER